jgi:ubiquinone/menaquinone biosynthesis C-methylase UbiE
MSFYDRQVLPRLLDRGMRNKAMRTYRPRIPPLACGRVLEIGLGSGLNLPYYTRAVTHLFGLEPSDHLRDMAAARADDAPFPVTLIGAGAENIPLETHSVNSVVTTWTLCSIPAVEAALVEIRRVLKPGGRLLFLEHGRAPDAGVARLQDRLTPMLVNLIGCHPNRPMESLITTAGFQVTSMDAQYLDGPRFISYHYIGQAQSA